MKLVERRIAIEAPAAVVYRHLTTEEGLLRWIGVRAVAEPVPGGRLEWTHEDGNTMLGRFIELDEPRRIVFAYGWKGDFMGVPPESTTVEIELVEDAGTTTLSLVQRGLPGPVVEAHDQGWDYFLGQLAGSLVERTSA